MRRAVFILLLLISPFYSATVTAQEEIDSLESLLGSGLKKEARLEVTLQLANHFRFAEPLKGKSYSLQARALAKEQKNDLALGDALHYLASSYFQVTQYDSSEFYNQQALEIRTKTGDEKGLAASYTNLGQLYGDRGKPATAFEYLHRAEKIYAGLKMERHLSIIYNSLGNLYYGQKLYELAHKYHHLALSMRQKIGDDYGLVASLGNLGHTSYYLSGKDSAQFYYQLAEQKAENNNDIYSQIQALNNLGAFYSDIDDNYKAIATLRKAIKLGEGTEYEELLANAFINYAKLVSEVKKDHQEALRYALKGEQLIRNQKLPEQLYQALNVIASIYSAKGDHRLAYLYMNNAFLVKDTAIRQEVQRQISELDSKYENEKKQLEIENLRQREKLGEAQLSAKTAEVNRKSLQLILVGALAVFLLVISYIAYKAYGQKRAANLEISRQKEEAELQSELLAQKNHEILDSITYAKRLQEAILPPLDELNKFCPQNFVLYLPKDIVAGDFYWLHATDEGHTFIAAADCTGHGVPGALVSVVCSNALNRGVLEVQGDNPAALLDRVRTMVLDTFRKSSKAVKDGMDISLASLQLKNDGARLKWAGANNPLWIIRADGTFEEIKADKQSVGQNEFEKPFTANDFQLAKNDTIYLFTDGYADQFGQSAEAWAAHRLSVNRESMPTGKKFKYRQLKDLLLSIRDRSMIEQQEILLEKFHSWKGELEQVDDVCIIGIRI